MHALKLSIGEENLPLDPRWEQITLNVFIIRSSTRATWILFTGPITSGDYV